MKTLGYLLLTYLFISNSIASVGDIATFSVGNKYIYKGSLLVLPAGGPVYVSASYSEEIVADTTIDAHRYFVFITPDRQWAPQYPSDTGVVFYRRADSTRVYRYNTSTLKEDTIIDFSNTTDSLLVFGKHYTSASKYLMTYASSFYLVEYLVVGLYEGQMFLSSARINGIASGDTTLLSVPSATYHPRQYLLSQNYPNPFNPRTHIQFYAPLRGYVTLKVYDLLGKTVAILVDNVIEAGWHSIQFDGTKLPSGIYFCCLHDSYSFQTKKLLLLK